MKSPDFAAEWAWPLKLSSYDRTVALSTVELSFLTTEPELRINFSGPRWPALAPVRRLIEPLDDAFLAIVMSKLKRDHLLSLLLQGMRERRKTFWGWTEQDWIDIATRHRYFGHWLVAVAYLLCGFRRLYAFPKRSQVFSVVAQHVFGSERLDAIAVQLQRELAGLGYKPRTLRLVPLTVAHLLLLTRSPHLENLTEEIFRELQSALADGSTEKCLIAISRPLAAKGIMTEPLKRLGCSRYLDNPQALLLNIAPAWARVARYWHDHSTASPKMRITGYYRILGVGRWLNATHPEILSPDQWTRTTAVEAVAMMANEKSGEWSHDPSHRVRNVGKQYAPSTRMGSMTTLRSFFQDLQQWEVIPRRFDPYRAFRCPRSIACLVRPNPRVLADDIWAKLVWAGMNLVESDLKGQSGAGGAFHYYPFSLVRALAVVWLFSGLRWNEIRRLRLGCIRWQGESTAERVCLISIPVSKTAAAFTKPVDRLAGQAIKAWELERPSQGTMLDLRTGEQIDFLFQFRMHQLGSQYLNKVLIPALCKKAGVPESDIRGPITGHRARSTIASQLFSSRNPMSLFELQQWLGHKHPSSTQHYINISPTKLMNSYAKAGYLERNVRAIEVLIDQDAVWKGLSGKEPWKFFDLGHGYCTYDFFDQCPHRMACAQCSFYVPKQSSRAQVLEAKANLLRLRQDIPLNEPELAAVNDGLAAYEKLLVTLMDMPTPDGDTPRQLSAQSLQQIKRS